MFRKIAKLRTIDNYVRARGELAAVSERNGRPKFRSINGSHWITSTSPALSLEDKRGAAMYAMAFDFDRTIPRFILEDRHANRACEVVLASHFSASS